MIYNFRAALIVSFGIVSFLGLAANHGMAINEVSPTTVEQQVEMQLSK